MASALAVALFGSGGCGSTATITRMTGPTLEARIDRSDDQRLYVTTAHDSRYTVERSDVVAIDHPGNVVAVIGLGYLALGALMFFGTPSPSQGEGSGFEGIPRAMGVLGMAIGIPAALWGGMSHLRSLQAARWSGPPVSRQ